jgi:hypothetical protein
MDKSAILAEAHNTLERLDNLQPHYAEPSVPDKTEVWAARHREQEILRAAADIRRKYETAEERQARQAPRVQIQPAPDNDDEIAMVLKAFLEAMVRLENEIVLITKRLDLMDKDRAQGGKGGKVVDIPNFLTKRASA